MNSDNNSNNSNTVTMTETKRLVLFDNDRKIYTFNCPHCDIFIEVEHNQVNCQIFRCGVYKHNNTQVNQHLNKSTCDELSNGGKVWGCCKPFRFFHGEQPYVDICDYI